MGKSLSSFLLYTACGTFIYAICAGFRDNYGIMLPYIAGVNGIAYDSVSFVIALGQLFFGLMQPVFGYMALRVSARFVLCLGAMMMLGGILLIPFSTSMPPLIFTLGILLPSGTAAASFGIIMSCVAPNLSERESHISGGIVAGGIGFGICILSPVIQGWISAYGLVKALFLLAIPVLTLLPAALALTRGAQSKASPNEEPTLGVLLGSAFANAVYLRVAFGFFTCGFHMALIQTHLFSQLTAFGFSEKAAAWALSIYGLGVIAGSTGSGWAGTRWRMSAILASLYCSRCFWVGLLLFSLPVPGLMLVILLLGMTGVATVAPTAGIIRGLFGGQSLPTLFGMVYLVHQIGAFCSAWAGGLCLRFTNSYGAVWHIDILLCLLAGLACADIRRHSSYL